MNDQNVERKLVLTLAYLWLTCGILIHCLRYAVQSTRCTEKNGMPTNFIRHAIVHMCEKQNANKVHPSCDANMYRYVPPVCEFVNKRMPTIIVVIISATSCRTASEITIVCMKGVF